MNMPLKKHGGKRLGSGRPSGSGRFPGATLSRIQIPQDLREEVLDFASAHFAATQQTLETPAQAMPGHLFLPKQGTETSIPLFSSGVRAGFPSPAEDHIDGYLDLNRLLIKDPDTTFLVRVEGDSMNGAGIDEGDILIVSRGLDAQNGDIVVAVVDNEFTVKRLKRERGRVWLAPENPAYPVVDLSRAETAQIWGVVTSAIKRFRKEATLPRKD